MKGLETDVDSTDPGRSMSRFQSDGPGPGPGPSLGPGRCPRRWSGRSRVLIRWSEVFVVVDVVVLCLFGVLVLGLGLGSQRLIRDQSLDTSFGW